ncbi:inositol monophosphatase family protein [Ciceribacter sp. RN22]|uniref:inositol monophosphatase family protein n=1 Tax=Ciceribacter sp. RN22 TaxID=2954932 RepID=UPI0020937FDB|nr:inositol monophosphatase family protein [Ciceribacter sp. RN22]MCO6178036.1 inositol monophosphatase [Ciceribacter sp. RN22]
MLAIYEIIEVAKKAAQEAGQAVVEHWSAYKQDVRAKGATDVVCAADYASDRIISAAIQTAFPSHRIMSEEDATAQEIDYSGPLWIVDPIDGTANYIRGHRYFGISIAFAFDGVVRAGCVHAPMLAETFLATKGGGATLNGSPIRVSAPPTLSQSIISTGFPHEKSDFSLLLKRFDSLLRNCQDVRRSASPVLDIAYVAMGRLDAHTETLFPWDVAAAGLIATEAGAERSNMVPIPPGIPIDLFGDEVVFSAPEVHAELVELLAARG